MVDLAIVIAATFFGALWRRWFGGWIPVQWPRIIRMSTGGLLAVAISYPFIQEWQFLAGVFAFTLVYMPKPDNEFLKPVLDWLYGKEPYGDPTTQAERDICGMALRYGIFSVLGGALLANFYSLSAGIIFAPMGFIPAIGYWWAWDRYHSSKIKTYVFGSLFLDGPTSIGELTIGASYFGGLALALAFM